MWRKFELLHVIGNLKFLAAPCILHRISILYCSCTRYQLPVAFKKVSQNCYCSHLFVAKVCEFFFRKVKIRNFPSKRDKKVCKPPLKSNGAKILYLRVLRIQFPIPWGLGGGGTCMVSKPYC